jgi:hypothetical protein
VQTFILRTPPCGTWTRIDCRFGLKTRGVRLLAWETLLPNWGPLPQTSQRLAMITDLLFERAHDSHSVDRREYLKRKLIANETISGQGRPRAGEYGFILASISGKSRIIS